MTAMRAVIVMDYQNVHLTGHGLFAISKYRPPHESLVDPLHFGNQLIQARNKAQRPGMDHATLSHIFVYRGQPSPEHDPEAYARNQAQKAQWERDPRAIVQLRPLKYNYTYDGGCRIVAGKREKGVDVLCALALVREALKPETDVIILASHDSDLEPALDEVLSLRCAKVETFCWFDPVHYTRQLRPSGKAVWNTRLGEREFQDCWDLTDYS